MTKKAQEKVLTKWEAISLACDAARYCGISQSDIAVMNVMMDVRIENLVHGTLEIPPQENQAP